MSHRFQTYNHYNYCDSQIQKIVETHQSTPESQYVHYNMIICRFLIFLCYLMILFIWFVEYWVFTESLYSFNLFSFVSKGVVIHVCKFINFYCIFVDSCCKNPYLWNLGKILQPSLSYHHMLSGVTIWWYFLCLQQNLLERKVEERWILGVGIEW